MIIYWRVIMHRFRILMQFCFFVVVILYVTKKVTQPQVSFGTNYQFSANDRKRAPIQNRKIEKGDIKVSEDSLKSKLKKIKNYAKSKNRFNFDLRKTKRQPQFREVSYSVIRKNRKVPLKRKQPVLLIWWPPTYLKSMQYLERNFQGVCGNCRLTTDRSLLHRATTLLFDNVPSVMNINDMPPARRPEQSYVLWNRETPAKVLHRKYLMEGEFDTMFNYTMSYHRSSDIVWYLGNMQFAQLSMERSNLSDPQTYIDDIIASKRSVAAWVVSNCNRTKGAVARMAYTRELMDSGLRIDLYGTCFNNLVAKDNFTELLAQYKFYLAFENSIHCKDYITEKFWRNGLKSNTVPIVWGPSRKDLKEIAPPNSYIHVEDFDTPNDLVQYINYLDKNEAEYRKYFEWRKLPFTDEYPEQMIRPGYESGICKLCRLVLENGGSLPPKRLKSAKSWLFDKESDEQCLLFDQENGNSPEQ